MRLALSMKSPSRHYQSHWEVKAARHAPMGVSLPSNRVWMLCKQKSAVNSTHKDGLGNFSRTWSECLNRNSPMQSSLADLSKKHSFCYLGGWIPSTNTRSTCQGMKAISKTLQTALKFSPVVKACEGLGQHWGGCTWPWHKQVSPFSAIERENLLLVTALLLW